MKPAPENLSSHVASHLPTSPAPSLKFAAAIKEAEPISLDEAALRMGVARDEVIDCVRRGKLHTTTRHDEICVLWPTDAGDAQNNEIATDAFSSPKHSEDPKWLHTVIGISMIGLFFIAAVYLMATIALSFLRPATTTL